MLTEQKKQKKCEKLQGKYNKQLAKSHKHEQKAQKIMCRLEEWQAKDVKAESEKKHAKWLKRQEKKAKHRALNAPPELSVLEEIGNSVTHGLGAIFAVVALSLMLLKSDTPLKITASFVYGFSLFFMMLASCLYHAFPKGSTVKRVFRRFDYSSIYLLIGGTFAPLLLVYLGNVFGFVVFAVQWVAIITGITMVCVFGPGRLKWLNFTLYFVIGWSGLLFIPDWIANNLPLLWFILGGGIVYTVGMIPFVFRGKKAAHFIWHFFVLAGAVVQFCGIYLFVF
jgi:hemolysin III